VRVERCPHCGRLMRVRPTRFDRWLFSDDPAAVRARLMIERDEYILRGLRVGAFQQPFSHRSG
jgi:hypothetical protein